MQTPKRKLGQFSHLKPDPYMTQEKFNALKNKLKNLKIKQPFLINEVKRLALDGDFSENAAYQIAKGQLRGLNQRLQDTEDHLANAIIINHQNNNSVQIGSKVIVEIEKKEKTFYILGPTETNPDKGIISYTSPIGSALLNKKTGEKIILKLKHSTKIYKIKKIF